MKHFIVNADRFEVEGIRWVTERDIELIFDPDPALGDEVVFSNAHDLGTLAAEAGVFPSGSQARANGLKGPIPHGVRLFGTKKVRFWVWNPVDDGQVPTVKPEFDRTERWWKNRDS